MQAQSLANAQIAEASSRNRSFLILSAVRQRRLDFVGKGNAGQARREPLITSKLRGRRSELTQRSCQLVLHRWLSGETRSFLDSLASGVIIRAHNCAPVDHRKRGVAAMRLSVWLVEFIKLLGGRRLHPLNAECPICHRMVRLHYNKAGR